MPSAMKVLIPIVIGLAVALSGSWLSAEIAYRKPLNEAGQSGVCLHGDRLFLTIHSKLEGPLKGGFYFNSDIVGQCFDKNSGKLLWQIEPARHVERDVSSSHGTTRPACFRLQPTSMSSFTT